MILGNIKMGIPGAIKNCLLGQPTFVLDIARRVNLQYEAASVQYHLTSRAIDDPRQHKKWDFPEQSRRILTTVQCCRQLPPHNCSDVLYCCNQKEDLFVQSDQSNRTSNITFLNRRWWWVRKWDDSCCGHFYSSQECQKHKKTKNRDRMLFFIWANDLLGLYAEILTNQRS